jgi:hypothetical protein
MIKITNQEDMIQIADLYLHKHSNITQEELYFMNDFEKYYQARELVKKWNNLPKPILNNFILSLEINGIVAPAYNDLK